MVHNQIHQYAIKYSRLGNNPKLIEKIGKVGLTEDEVKKYIEEVFNMEAPAEPDAPVTDEQGGNSGNEQGNAGTGESNTPVDEPSTPVDEPSTPVDGPDVTDEPNEEDEGISTGVVEE